MRRVIAWLLAGLPFDARSRRAIDETLLDWEGEATEAKTLAEVTEAEIHGVVSILRVASLSMLRESIDFSWVRGLGRRFAVAGAVVVGLAVVLSAAVTREFALPLRMLLWFVPTVATVALPAALLLIIAWRPSGRCVPTLGASWIAGISAVIAMQVVTVLAGEMFLSLTYSDIGLERPAARPWSWLQPGVLLGVVAMSAVVGSAVVLAASLATRSGLQSRWWLVSVPVVSLIVPGGVQVAMRTVLFYAGLSEYRAYSDLVVAFGLAAAVLVLAAKIGPRGIPAGEGQA